MLSLLNGTLTHRLKSTCNGVKDPFRSITKFCWETCTWVDRERGLIEKRTIAQLEDAFSRVRSKRDVFWQLLADFRAEVKPESQDIVRQMHRSIWLTYCSISLLYELIGNTVSAGGEYDWCPALLYKKATHFAFVDTIMGRSMIHPSSAALQDFTVTQTMRALSNLCSALDDFGWSPSGGEYLYALFLRYAMLLQKEKNLPDPGPYGVHTELGLMETEALEPGSGVTDAFLDIGERLFFHHLWRSEAVSVFLRQRPYAPTPVLADHLQALHKALLDVLAHEYLREPVNNAIATAVLSRFIYPGEREQLLFQYTDATDTDANTILFRLRFDTFNKLQPLNQALYADILNAYFAGLNPDPFPTLEAAALERHSISERVLLLVFEACFDATLRTDACETPFAIHAYCDDRTPSYPDDLCPRNVEHAMRGIKLRPITWPLFIAIWQNYIVVVGEKITCYTPHLPEALLAWLSGAIRLGVLNQKSIRPPWNALFDLLSA